jgi:acyl-homoserine lactone acylase PvdQ
MRAAAAVALVLALGAGIAADAAPRRDYASIALNVLPPGEAQAGSHLTDQLAMYDGLTPLGGTVTAAELRRFFKPETLGLGGVRPARTERPRAGVRILRDRWDVPHVYGTTRANTEFGAGWVTAEDRGLYLQLLRGPARIAALDVPGYDAFGLATSGRQFVPSAQTEAFLAQQVSLLRSAGPRGLQMLRDVDAYLAGVNAYFKSQGGFVQPFTRNDVIAIGALVGAVFGAGGGGEALSSELLGALEQRLGAAGGLGAWNDLREAEDPEAPVTIAKPFPYETGQTAPGPGNVMLDPGSFVSAATTTQRRLMSNALLVGAKRSANGHPIFVAGPQVGYFAPEILMEEDLHGGGLDARGVAFPGLGFYLQIGRGVDYAWSATSASSDVIDTFAETLCGGDDVHYVYKGACRAMDTFDAGTLKGAPGAPDSELVYRTTVHGPVFGYASAGGKRVALSLARSTRGRELLSAIPFQELTTDAVHDPASFFAAMGKFELTFNWMYADSKHIAFYSSGRLPLRADGVNGGLPTNGDGDYEWRGFLAAGAHAHGADPARGTIVNWNNKPAAEFSAADSNFSYGSVYRVDLLNAALAAHVRHTPASVVAAMNLAAGEDLRRFRIWGELRDMLVRTPAPNARDQRMVDLVQAWDGNRLDRNGDGKIDDAGAAIMDAAWPRIAHAILDPVIGPEASALLARLQPPDQPPNSQGSAYEVGWYGYVDKDLRDVAGPPPRGAFSRKYCGGGDVLACSRVLWAAVDAAGDALQAAQGPDPSAWRADANAERIGFAGFAPLTMRWTNRPTFQQVISFSAHRPG